MVAVRDERTHQVHILHRNFLMILMDIVTEKLSHLVALAENL